MTEHIKYQSITNNYQTEYIKRFKENYSQQFENNRFVVTEKIDGTSVQILITKDNIHYGRRNDWLKPDESFFNYQQVMKRYEKDFKLIQDHVKQFRLDHVRVYAEMFGSKVINRVSYQEETQLRILTIAISQNSDERIMPMSRAIDILTIIGLKGLSPSNSLTFVPALGLFDTLEEALEFDTDIDSVLSKEKDNQMEGVVIAGYDKVILNNEKEYFIVKKKNEKFLEKNHEKITVELDEDKITEFLNYQLNYLNENRLISCFSKLGVISSKKDIGKYLLHIKNDIMEEFRVDHPEYYELDDKERNAIDGKLNKAIVNQLMGKLA